MLDDQTVNILNLRRGLLSAMLNEFSVKFATKWFKWLLTASHERRISGCQVDTKKKKTSDFSVRVMQKYKQCKACELFA